VLSFKEHGLDKFGRLIDQNIAQAMSSRPHPGRPELELMAPARFNMSASVTPAGLGEAGLNQFNEELLIRLHESGIAAPSYTTLNGRYACARRFRTTARAPTTSRSWSTPYEARRGAGQERRLISLAVDCPSRGLLSFGSGRKGSTRGDPWRRKAKRRQKRSTQRGSGARQADRGTHAPVGTLEDAAAIRILQHQYGYYLDKCCTGK